MSDNQKHREREVFWESVKWIARKFIIYVWFILLASFIILALIVGFKQ